MATTVAAAQLSLSFSPIAIAFIPSSSSSSSARHTRISPPKPTPPHPLPLLLPPKLLHHSSTFTAISRTRRNQQGRLVATAIEEGQEQNPNPSTSSDNEKQSIEEESSVLKNEALKAALTRNDEQSGGGGELWSGVAEEIREIEWPAFGKVVGTTGVVLGVIAGSSVVLLTVNAVLAELSDRVFAGRGVQDFFG